MTYGSGKSRGLGVVEYATIDEAQKAMDNLYGTKMLDRPIFMRESMIDSPLIQLKRNPNPDIELSEYKPRVFINNLSLNTSWDELKDLLKTGMVMKYFDMLQILEIYYRLFSWKHPSRNHLDGWQG